jgi:hypothetical protein
MMTPVSLLVTTTCLIGAASPLEEHVIAGKTARLEFSALKITLSGEITVTVSVEGPAPVEVGPLHYLTPSRDWDEQALPAGTTDLPNGRQRWQQRFRLEPRAPTEPGKPAQLELMPLKLRGGSEVKWKPVAVEVTTSISKADLDKARDITPIETVPPAPPRFPWLLTLGFGLAGLAGLAAVVVGVRRWRYRPVLELPPEKRALRELDRLAAMDLSSRNGGELCPARLAEVVRTYVDDRFDLRSREQTTEEFLGSLAEPPWPVEQQEQLAGLLRRCDLAKFARIPFTAAECQAAIAQARSFVNGGLTPPRLAKVTQ